MNPRFIAAEAIPVGTQHRCAPFVKVAVTNAWRRSSPVRAAAKVAALLLLFFAAAKVSRAAAPPSRRSRTISRADVLAAIQAAIVKNPTLSSVDLSTLAFDLAIQIPDADPQLEVIQARLDVPLDSVHFRLAARSAPNLVPFVATARLSAHAVQPTIAAARFIASAPLLPSAAPVLVPAGRFARLHIRSGESVMDLVVKVLQRGRLGEVIRVQLPGTRKVLQGRVVAPGRLDATL